MISRSSYLIELVSRYPLRFFVIGILLFQVLVLGSAGILSWRWPSSESSWNADPVSLESSAEVSQDLVSSIETGEEQDNSAGLFASIDIDRLQAAQSEEDTEAMFTEAVDYDQIGAELRSKLDQAARTITVTIGRGDTLLRIWRKHGGQVAEALRAGKAIEGAGASVRLFKQGEQLELFFDDSGSLIGFSKALDKQRTLLLVFDRSQVEAQAQFVAHVSKVSLVERERVVVGKIETSFAAAVVAGGVPYAVVDELVDLFSSRVNFRRDFRRGDRFTIIYSEKRIPSGETIEPGIISAASLTVRGKYSAVIRHIGDDGNPRYFDQSGTAVGNYFLRYPLKFTRITSVFSKSRFHPILKRRRPHNGVDFAAPTGTPVRSVADGLVVFAGWNGGAGKMVKVSHGSRYSTAYLHLSRIGKGVRKGTRVRRGQVIGAVGRTGYATGPHLHFSLYDRGRYVDPFKVPLPTQGPEEKHAIGTRYLAAALNTLQHYGKIQVASNEQT